MLEHEQIVVLKERIKELEENYAAQALAMKANKAMLQAETRRADKNAKDAERWAWMREKFTGYDFNWMPSETGKLDGKVCAVFDVGWVFNGTKDIEASVDRAINYERTEQGENV